MATSVIKAIPESLRHTYDIPDVIYHYTSPEGLIGIIKNSELWFSRFDCLNDADEGEYIKSLYRQVVTALRGTYGDPFIDAIMSVKPDYHRYYKIKNSPVTKTEDSESYYAMPVNTTPYICCFSENDDSLPMWNYYSKNGQYEGYNIGFRLKDMPRSEDINIYKCVYDEQDQIGILEHLIENEYENYSKYGNRIEIICERLKGALSTEAIRFKNPAYKHEEEARMVYWVPEKNEDVETVVPEMNFRQTHGIIIPYIRKTIDLQQCLESITIGPMIKSNIAEKTVTDLLTSKGISSKIKKSGIPVRY